MTCEMVEGVGCRSVCAKVCHKNIPSQCVELARMIDSHQQKLLDGLTNSSCVPALLELARSLL